MTKDQTIEDFERQLQRMGFTETNVNYLAVWPAGASMLPYADVIIEALPSMRPGVDQTALVNLLAHRSLRRRAIPVLLDMLEDRHNSPSVRWSVADALERHATAVSAETLISLSKKRELGQARRLIVLALSKKDGPAVTQALSEALEDDEVAWDAMKAISRAPRKFIQLKPQVLPYLTSDIREMRRIATTLVAKLSALE